ncbi:hypothetical protein GWI33_007779 [Rhynchophorus ferrugineus]|uniref:Very-long-chain (3R)-3-hydroxyacyl-CoA dehydratase n=1 Tax=Rhynchophorus ferrugineus TaxID=354439 RepID=A0A834MGE5_RHYFE|nr:hypothetical protein GWI33_007779 [Rhynchophorus ferrugineus]
MSNAKSDNRSKFINFYLIAYNFLQTLGWTLIFIKLLLYYTQSGNDSLYDVVKYPLFIFQNAAVLEVFHAIARIVSSNPVMTAFQVASRVVLVCGVLLLSETSRLGIGLPMALFAWSITEIIRYSNYTFQLVNSVPYPLKYLRYTTFIVLYPIGVTGELLCLWWAQKEIGENNQYSIDMPNKYNFIFNYQHLLWFIMVLYIPQFPQLFLYMCNQRKKALSKVKTT